MNDPETLNYIFFGDHTTDRILLPSYLSLSTVITIIIIITTISLSNMDYK